MLLERPGEVVTRDDLRRRLWPDDVFVDFENNLNTAVARLREALGDSAERPRFIETLPEARLPLHRNPLGSRSCAGDPRGRARTRLLVLPFVNLTGDPAQEYFSDAMTDELITELAALAPDALAVIARTTAMHYKGSHKDVARIGRELNVDYVVEGAVRRVGRVRHGQRAAYSGQRPGARVGEAVRGDARRRLRHSGCGRAGDRRRVGRQHPVKSGDGALRRRRGRPRAIRSLTRSMSRAAATSTPFEQ